MSSPLRVLILLACLGLLIAPSLAEEDQMNSNITWQDVSITNGACDLPIHSSRASESESTSSRPSDDSLFPDDSENVMIELVIENYTISRDKDGYDLIIMDNFSSLSSPGDPVLPLRRYNVLIPFDAELSSVRLEIVSSEKHLLNGTFAIRPASPQMTNDSSRIEWGPGKEIIDGKNTIVYESDADYPADYLTVLPASQMRKWKFIPLEFMPFQYNPVTGKLTLIQSVTIRISYSQAKYAGAKDTHLQEDTIFDDLAASTFINYPQMVRHYTGADLTASWPGPRSVGYAIVTTNSIKTNSAKLDAFIDHKRSLGYDVLTVTEDDFGSLTGEYPNHKAEKIRQWLKNNYLSRGIKYVLLIGNPSTYESFTGEGDIPMKMCWPNKINGIPADSTPTDSFYSDLSGDWDLDDDGLYGELNDDYGPAGGVDFAPEVIVGRIPVYNSDYSSLDNILQKIIDYESDSSRWWRKNALLPMSFLSEVVDGAVLGEKIKDDLLVPNGYSYWRIYQQGSGKCGTYSSYASDQDLKADTSTRDRWAANPYGIVCWVGHGGDVVAQVGWYSAIWDCIDGYFFRSEYCSRLNDDRPSFTYQGSCNNGYPESANNLQYEILKQGGIVTVAATRLSWFSGESYDDIPGSNSIFGIGYEYIKRLAQEQPGGDALAQVKVGNPLPVGNGWLQNYYDFNIYGDPSVGMNTGSCLYEDDFDQLDANIWIKYGSPEPQVLGSAEGRYGVFDNNGDSWCDSGIVSKNTLSLPWGSSMSTDIFLRVTDPRGCWADTWFGLTTPNTPSGSGVCPSEDYSKGVYFGIEYAGDARGMTPVDKRRHAYIKGGFLTENGTWEDIGSYLNADSYINGWHEFLIYVGADRQVGFYVDGDQIYSSVNKISVDVLSNKKAILGGRSSGSAGKAYHDYIKIECNRIPAVPSIPSGPSAGTKGEDYSFSTSAADPDGDQVKYTISWGDGTFEGTNFLPSGTIISVSHIWGSSGIYFVQAMATDSKGASSAWSDVAAIKISGQHSIFYPDFTDTANPDSWRSWLVLQNPMPQAENVEIELRSRSGGYLFSGSHTIPANGVSVMRPRDLVGSDCAGSVVVTSDHPITGNCQITRNSNEMCMGYNSLNHGSTTLYYPDFTDTANPDGWRSWLVLQNPAASQARLSLEIRSRSGGVLYSGGLIIPAHGVNAIRPRNLIGSDCAGSVVIESDLPIIGTCQITRNSNKMCMSYTASDHGSATLYYPDFTDTANPESWRSWLVLQNPSATPANLIYEIRSRAGDVLYTGSDIIPAHGVNAIRPRTLTGTDCAGSVVITSDQPIVGTCQITRNSNEMCMSYNALQQGSTELNYPDFTDTANSDSWRSWLVLQNPTAIAANVNLEIRSREGALLYSGSQSIPAHGVSAIRPRGLVGSDCSGSAVVTSDQPITGTCQITRNNNMMCMSYTAFGTISVDWLPSV